MICNHCNKIECEDVSYKWCEECRLKHRATIKAWNKKNPSKSRARANAWREAHPEKRYAQSRLYKARKKEKDPTWYSFTTCRAQARQRGIEFNLPRLLSDDLVTDYCFYCGAEPSPTNGIDRVDNLKGYIEGNVVSCCSDCNYAKKARTVMEFKEWSLRVADRMRDFEVTA